MKTFFRFLIRNKLYTLVNVFGLTLSLVFVIVLAAFTDSLLTDRQHKRSSDLYISDMTKSPFFQYDAMMTTVRQMPEIEKVAPFGNYYFKIFKGRADKAATEETQMLTVDSVFFQLYHVDVVAGDAEQAIKSGTGCVLTESLATTLFGDKNPIGQPLHLVSSWHDTGTSFDVTVMAVVKDLKRTALSNASQGFVPMQVRRELDGEDYLSRWGQTIMSEMLFYMVRCNPSVRHSLDDFNARAAKIYNSVMTNKENAEKDNFLTFVPIKNRIFAESQYEVGAFEHGDKGKMTIFFTAAMAILLFAIINYVNLTVAQTSFRAKEMSLRRLFGTGRWQTSKKLFGESLTLISISALIALGLSFLVEGKASELLGSTVKIADSLTLQNILIAVAFIIIIAIVSAIVPASILSRYKPIDVVHGTFRYKSKQLFGKIFIALQCAISIVLVTASLTIWRQTRYMIAAPLGYDYTNLISANLNGIRMGMTEDDLKEGNPSQAMLTLREELRRLPSIKAISLSSSSISGQDFSGSAIGDITDRNICHIICADSSWFSVMGIKLLADYHTNSDIACYLNENAMKVLHLKREPQNFIFATNGADLIKHNDLAGVFTDFHCGAITRPIMPTALLITDFDHPHGNNIAAAGSINIRTTAQTAEILEQIKKTCEKIGFDTDKIEFFSDHIYDQFEEQRTLGQLVVCFMVIAIIISMLGSLAMATFFVRQRRKDIAVRKVLGSSSSEVTRYVLRQYMLPIVIGTAVAIPLSWRIMEQWLSQYSYRVGFGWWPAVAASVVVVGLALVSAMAGTESVARSNPAKWINKE